MKWIVFVVFIGAVLIAFLGLLGARINTTQSIPVGLYWVSNKPIQRHSFVMFCPPNSPVISMAKKRGYIPNGLCLGGYSYVMKMVAATKGDIVTINNTGVYVNGLKVAHSKPLKNDPAGRPLIYVHLTDYKLKDSELLLMTNISNLSFDSRYFGPVNQSQVRDVIRPIFTW